MPIAAATGRASHGAIDAHSRSCGSAHRERLYVDAVVSVRGNWYAIDVRRGCRSEGCRSSHPATDRDFQPERFPAVTQAGSPTAIPADLAGATMVGSSSDGVILSTPAMFVEAVAHVVAAGGRDRRIERQQIAHRVAILGGSGDGSFRFGRGFGLRAASRSMERSSHDASASMCAASDAGAPRWQSEWCGACESPLPHGGAGGTAARSMVSSARPRLQPGVVTGTQ